MIEETDNHKEWLPTLKTTGIAIKGQRIWLRIIILQQNF